MKRKELFSFLKTNKNFSHLWSSQILSLVTVNMVNFMMMTRIYEKTGSALAVSFLWIFYYLPAFFVGPFSGLLVDRFSKRKILLYTNILQSLTMLLYLFIGEKTYPIYTFVFLYSLIDEFYVPAEASSLPGLVKKEDLPLANSLFFSTSQGALIIGFGLSGILMRVLGKNNIIVLAAIFLLLAGLSVYFLPETKPKGKKINSFFRFWSEIKTGYVFIASRRIVLFPMIMSIVFGVLLTVFGVSLPVIASELLKIDVQDAGPLLVIPLGLGAILGMAAVTKLSVKFRKKDFIRTGCIIAFVIFMIMSLFLPYFGKLTVLLAVFLVFALGFAGLLVHIPTHTLLQEHVPSNLRGRVFGTLNFIYTVVTLPFLLFSATMIDTFGIRPFIFIAGLFVFIFLYLFKRVEILVMAEQNTIQNESK